MMRFTYPRSFLSLLVIGFTIVAAPLLFALFSNALAFERLAGLSEQAVHSAVKVTQASGVPEIEMVSGLSVPSLV